MGLEFDQYSHVCLGIEGEQVSPDGRRVEVTGFEEAGPPAQSCVPALPDPSIWVSLPPEWGIFKRPIWWPQWPSVEPLDLGILAHVDAFSHGPPAGGLSTNQLIHFPNLFSQTPFAGLAEALAGMRRGRFALSVMLVFPESTLRELSREQWELLMGLGDTAVKENPQEGRSPVHFQVTEDTQGGWSSLFGAKKGVNSFLINARGEFVWKQEQELIPHELAAALDEWLLPAAAPALRPLELAVRTGGRLPDGWLDELLIAAGERRLRGRRAIVGFWQSWSTPCRRELMRLEQIYREGAEDAAIIGVCGDFTDESIAAVREELGLNFPLLHDAGLQVASRLKLNCWPTTLSVSADGVLEHVQFGCPPDVRGLGTRSRE